MRIPVLLIMLASLAAAPAPPAPPAPTRSSPPTSTPPASTLVTSTQTTQPLRIEDMEPLADGNVRYIPPPQWDLIEKRPDGVGARYRSRDGHALIDITIIPQTRAINLEAAREQMALIIAKGIRQGAIQAGQQLIVPPRVEADDRF